MSTLSLIKFDIGREGASEVFQKQLDERIMLDFENMQIVADHYKFFILVATPQIVIGLSMQDRKARLGFCDGQSQAGGRAEESAYRDHQYYVDSSSLSCIRPSVIFYRQLTRRDDVCHFKTSPGERQHSRLESSPMCSECAASTGIHEILRTRVTPVFLQATSPQTLQLGKLFQIHTLFDKNYFTSMLSARMSVYLSKTMRHLDLYFMESGSMRLDFDKYFPYDVSRIAPKRTKNVRVQVDSFRRTQFLFPRALKSPSLLGGVVSVRSRKQDVLDLLIVQKGQNTLLTNRFQALSGGEASSGNLASSLRANGTSNLGSSNDFANRNGAWFIFRHVKDTAKVGIPKVQASWLSYLKEVFFGRVYGYTGQSKIGHAADNAESDADSSRAVPTLNDEHAVIKLDRRSSSPSCQKYTQAILEKDSHDLMAMNGIFACNAKNSSDWQSWCVRTSTNPT